MAETLIGFIVLVALVLSGVLWGRVFCGKVCPFGFLQDLFFMIPFSKKIHAFKVDRYLRYFKYIFLAMMLIMGTYMLATSASMEREQDFSPTTLIMLVVFVAICIVMSRPLCKYLCPLGALLAPGNLLPFGKYALDQKACTSCKKCSAVCSMDIEPNKHPNDPECIRCGHCVKACPVKALSK